jgi:hypothetical protein
MDVMAQVVVCLLSKQKALNTNLRMARRKKRERERNIEKEIYLLSSIE